MSDYFSIEKQKLYKIKFLWSENRDIIFEYADKYYEKVVKYNKIYNDIDLYFVCLIISKKFLDDDAFYLDNTDYNVFKKMDMKILNNIEVFCLKILDYNLF